MNRSESVNSSLSSCCSLDRSTKRSDVCRMFTGFARTLNGQTPGREGDHKGRPYVLRVSVWFASRSRRHASASEHLRHNPTVAGLSICVGRVVDLRCVLTYPQLLAGTVADRVGTRRV